MANNTPGSSCGNIGILVSDGYNLEDGSSCNFNQTGDQSNVTGAATYLGPLKNNGGPTQTVALLTGSTAIDAIPLNACTDAFGNPVIADQRGITRPQGAAGKCDIGAFEVQQTPTANVCPNGQTTPAPCSYPITLRYFIPAGTTLGTNPVRAVTQGAPNLDFTLTPSNICSPVGSANCVVSSSPCANLAGPAYCTVQVTFAPLAPGLRMGAVELTDSNNNPVATTLIPGLGNGPAIAFGPGVQIPLDINPGGIGLNGPWGVAVDAAGDLFIADAGNSRVVEVPAGCTNSSCQVVVPATGLMNPTGVAVDGAGDLFISDQGSNLVVEVPYLGNGTYGSQTTLPASGLSYPKGVAVDGAGNVFIADFGSSRIVELPYVGNGAYGPQTTVGSAIQSPSAVAVDSAGDLFIGQPEAIVEVTPSGVQTTLPFQSGTFQIPSGVAVDAAGDVFATDQTNGYATELSPLANGTYGTQTFLVESNSAGPTGVAVDAAGDVFVVENGYNKVVEFMRSQPPSLGFASTPAGPDQQRQPAVGHHSKHWQQGAGCHQSWPGRHRTELPSGCGNRHACGLQQQLRAVGWSQLQSQHQLHAAELWPAEQHGRLHRQYAQRQSIGHANHRSARHGRGHAAGHHQRELRRLHHRGVRFLHSDHHRHAHPQHYGVGNFAKRAHVP